MHGKDTVYRRLVTSDASISPRDQKMPDLPSARLPLEASVLYVPRDRTFGKKFINNDFLKRTHVSQSFRSSCTVYSCEVHLVFHLGLIPATGDQTWDTVVKAERVTVVRAEV